VQATSITGNFSTLDLPTLYGGLRFELQRTASSVDLVVVPTPTSAALLTLVAGATLTRRRRRNR